jgi:hypothetical protein
VAPSKKNPPSFKRPLLDNFIPILLSHGIKKSQAACSKGFAAYWLEEKR